MRKGLGVALAATVLVVFSTAAAAKKQPQVSGLALQQIQARDYEVSKETAFPAVMTVLQDAGYRILAADKDTGLITGTASTKSGVGYSLFEGFNKKKKTPMVSAFIENRGGGSRIRLSFVMAKTKSSLYGMSSFDEEPILDPAVYRDAFGKIDKEVFVRQALNAPPPTPRPADSVNSPVTSSASLPKFIASSDCKSVPKWDPR